MAESGGQPGNQNAAKGKRWADALECAATAWPDEPDYENCRPEIAGLRRNAFDFMKRMRNAADKYASAYFSQYGDRMDGKPHQSQDVNLHGDLIVTVKNFVREK